jgi:hypothetical protein
VAVVVNPSIAHKHLRSSEPISSWFRSATCQVRAKRSGRDVCWIVECWN